MPPLFLSFWVRCCCNTNFSMGPCIPRKLKSLWNSGHNRSILDTDRTEPHQRNESICRCIFEFKDTYPPLCRKTDLNLRLVSITNGILSINTYLLTCSVFVVGSSTLDMTCLWKCRPSHACQILDSLMVFERGDMILVWLSKIYSVRLYADFNRLARLIWLINLTLALKGYSYLSLS